MENPTSIIVNQPNIILITVDQLRYPMQRRLSALVRGETFIRLA